MEFTLTSLLKWLLDILNSAVPIIVGVVIAGRINKFIDFCDNHCSEFDNWDDEEDRNG